MDQGYFQREKPAWGCTGIIVASVFSLFVLYGVVYAIAKYVIPPKEGGPRKPCASNLNQIGMAMRTYAIPNGGFFPYDERGPLHSLALLYPTYADNARIFRCGTVEGNRRKRRESSVFPEGTSLAGAPCDYGYTWRVSPDAAPDFPVAADMPDNHDSRGFHVLSFDGAVHWETTPFLAHNPADNIFAPEPGWSPDTDAWIRQR